MQVLEVDRGVLAGDDQIERVLLVLEEEVLAVGAGDGAAQVAGLLHREDRRMLDRRGDDAELAQVLRQVVAGRGHGGGDRGSGDLPLTRYQTSAGIVERGEVLMETLETRDRPRRRADADHRPGKSAIP